MTCNNETYETLTLCRSDGVAVITLQRPDRNNALGSQSGKDLRAVSLICDTDPLIRAVLLRAEGRNFCAGGDLVEFAAEPSLGPAVRDMTATFHVAISTFARMRSPLIVAAQGAIAGAGLSLLGIADVVVVGRSASFSIAYPGVGFSADGGMTWTLPRLIGLRRYQELVFTNRSVKAEEALQIGLITEIAEDDQVTERGTALAHQIAKGPTAAFAAIRRLVIETYHRPLEAQLEQESREIASLASGADAPAAIKAVLGRQRPTFIGS